MKHLLCGGMLLLSVQAALAGTVDATQYDAFWIWANVKPQAVWRSARTLYVLQGQIDASPKDETIVRFIAQGTPSPPLSRASIWLVYRANTLRWTPRVEKVMLAQLARWRAEGHNVVGVQIDFDAHTLHLQDYIDFLCGLRERLPADYRLSITGLLDWSSRVDADQVNQLKSVVDEVVVQTYQGRHTITNYDAYLPRVGRLKLPFRVGIVQRGEW